MNRLRFAGYAAIFNRIDRGGDVIRPGAFGELAPGLELPLLWQHDALQKIGRITHASEDSRGLRVIGELSDGTSAGRRALAMLAGSRLRGLSFGYRVRRAAGTRPRELLDLDVAEISLVMVPMQPMARIIAVA